MNYTVAMETDTNSIRASVQETLDELSQENLTPFKLTAYGVEADGGGQYLVAFCDSRIHSMTFSLKEGGSLRQVVRAAVLNRIRQACESGYIVHV